MATTGEQLLPVHERRTLFELVSMLAQQHKCQDIIDAVGLGGQLKSGDVVVLRVRTGRWIGAYETEIICNVPDRSSATPFILETKSTALKESHRAGFRVKVPEPDAAAADGPSRHYRLGVTNAHEVRALPRSIGAKDAETQFQVLSDRPGPILSGAAVYLKSSTGRTLEVDGETVRARTNEKGTLQRMNIEKISALNELPPPCPEHELSVQQKAWLIRRGVQNSLVDKQQIAKFLAGHKPGCQELLQAYTKLWESEWRLSWPQVLQATETAAEDSGGSPASRPESAPSGPATDRHQQRAHSRPRSRRQRQPFVGMFGGISPDDKRNGDLVVSAMRDFFSKAMYMAQLEADPVQRIIETFAAALTRDVSFLECFEASMLPEKERRDYKTPDEVLLGLTYTTMMLQTDFHNKQVTQKMWDRKKFEAAGKGVGVTPGLMLQIYKNVQKEPL
jgi:hypothetical protein